MEYLTNLLNRTLSFFKNQENLQYIGTYHFHPSHPEQNPSTYAAHQSLILNHMEQFLNSAEIDMITNQYRRSDATALAIDVDFFANNVPYHEIPFDHHVEYGLQCMLDAFRPPQLARPCHLNDVEHHYPYKWQVNAEPPFSTDRYFLDNLPHYRDFWNDETKRFDQYVDPTELQRRFADKDIDSMLDTKTPAKFGFVKNTVFSWTRRWHHIIKDAFSTTTHLASTAYYKSRYIFPMLLHTKTAIVKTHEPNKMRTIWGASKPWILAETMIYWEYLTWIKMHPGLTPMLWGYETFTGGWFRLNAELYSSHLKSSFLTIDFSRFDKRAYFQLIKRIMFGIRTFLDFHNGYVPNHSYPDTKTDWSPHKAQRLQNLWLWTLENLFDAPIVLPDGRMYIRRFAGIPSGLFITQPLDSWYDYTILATLLSAIGLDPKQCIIKVQGDDSIIRLGILIPPHEHENFLLKLQELADYYFKAVISLLKSEVRNNLNGCEVLSYRNNNGLAYRDEIVMLAQLYHTKARNPQPSITMAQAIGFAYAALGNNLRVHLLLESIYNHYKEQGYSPNRAGLALVFGNSPDLILPHYELDHFPTVSEVQAFCLATSYRNDEQEAKHWPPSYFSYPPCERPE